MLDEVLKPRLRLVVCGTAAGKRSATLGHYYAGRGNKFWRTLAETGLTPRQLSPEEYALLPSFGIGLTDLVRDQSGGDASIRFGGATVSEMQSRMRQFRPGVLCFNGKRAAAELLGKRKVEYGEQSETIGTTRLYVAPSTSGAASGSWDIELWFRLARLVRASASL